MPDDASQLTETDLTEFARQLYGWTKTLPEVQQGLLHRILSRAAAAEADDTSGYAFQGFTRHGNWTEGNGQPTNDGFLNLVHGAAGLSFGMGDGSVRVTGVQDGTSNTLL